MPAGTAPDHRALSAAAPATAGAPSWRVATLGFTLSLATTIALALALAAL